VHTDGAGSGPCGDHDGKYFIWTKPKSSPTVNRLYASLHWPTPVCLDPVDPPQLSRDDVDPAQLSESIGSSQPSCEISPSIAIAFLENALSDEKEQVARRGTIFAGEYRA
jgi:hypothetical protein